MRCVNRVLACLVSLGGATLLSSAALAQVQVLDSVDAFGSTSTTGTVLEMGFRESYPRTNFEALDIAASPIISCQRAVDQGLYCVVGSLIRFWPDTDDVRTHAGAEYIPFFNAVDCKDPALGLDTRKSNGCTSVTTDADGAIWIAGRKANSHSVFKIVEKARLEQDGQVCEARGTWRPLTSPTSQTSPELPDSTVPTYCAREFASGRPALLDINQLDFETAEHFITTGPAAGKYGVIGLERREDLSFFPDVGYGPLLSPVPVVSGKAGWGIGRGEELLTATLLQFGPGQNYAVAVSTLGKVIAKKIGSDGVGVGDAFTVFNIPANRNNGNQNPAVGAPGHISYARCVDDSTQMYGIRVSSESNRVYISDRNCGQILALEWIVNGGTGFPGKCDVGTLPGQAFCLANAREPVNSTVWSDVTLSTVSTSTNLSPAGISVSPGIGLNVNEECGFNDDGTPKTCPLVGDGDGNGANAAQLSGVRLEQNGAYGMTVYQVRGIPDCRDEPTAQSAQWKDVCSGVAVDSEGYMDIWSMLPPLVQDRVRENSNSVFDPKLLISPRYRGQQWNNQRTFDLFFGVTEQGMQFRDTFDGQFDVGDLTGGSKLGCGGTSSTANGGPDLAWDVVVTVSERFETVGGPGNAPANVDMLVNTGCFNPTQISGSRWSLYAYNMEVDEDFGGGGYPMGDAIYAGLLRQLLDQLQETQDTFACGNSTSAPLSSSTCTSLTAKWRQADGFLEECIASSTYPRANQGVNNCNAFLSQVGNYRDIVDTAIRQGPDPANRIGELIVRAKVIAYVYDHHFVPSIPPNGFCDIVGAECPAPAP